MERSSPVVHWPEMERLVDGLSSATAGKGRCCGICGPVGVGKTSLLRKLERTAGSLGFSVQKCSCGPGAGSKAIFASLLTYSGATLDREHPLSLLGTLEELSDLSPVLLTIEDLHLADPQVVPMLILMARNLAERPVMIAFTYDRDLIDTASGDVHPLADGLRILAREGVYEEVVLKPMDRLSLISLVEDEIMGKIDPSLAELIWAKSEGNPLVATETIRLLIQSKLVHKVGIAWKPSGPLDIDLPDSYRAILESRLRMLPSEDMGLLDIAAVVGVSFDPWIIARIQRRRPLDVLEQLDHMARDHHLLEEDGEHYRFTSSGVRGIIMDGLPEESYRELHRKVAEALETSSSDPAYDKLAEHYYQAESVQRCVCFSLLAAEKRIGEGRWEDALRELEKVLEASADRGYAEERRYAQDRMAEVKALMRM